MLYYNTGDIYSYLAMRDYPVVWKVDKSVPSPGFNPIIYAKFERIRSQHSKIVKGSVDSVEIAPVGRG